MIADNQIKWALKYAQSLDSKGYFSAEIVALLLEAFKYDLFPNTEPLFNEKDAQNIDEIFTLMPDTDVINRVKSEIAQLEVIS